MYPYKQHMLTLGMLIKRVGLIYLSALGFGFFSCAFSAYASEKNKKRFANFHRKGLGSAVARSRMAPKYPK